MLCEQVMQRDVVTCRDSAPVGTIARMMRDRGVGFLVVVEGSGRPIGVVTDRDLVVRALANDAPARLPVAEIMSRPPLLICRPTDDLIRVELAMADARKSRALVLDDTGVLVGVITLSDVARLEPSPGLTGWLLREVAHSRASSPAFAAAEEKTP